MWNHKRIAKAIWSNSNNAKASLIPNSSNSTDLS